MASLPEGVAIREGGYYKRRDGVVVQLLESDDSSIPWCLGPSSGENRCWYHFDGRPHCSGHRAIAVEIVAEVQADGSPLYAADPASVLPTDSAERKNTPVYSGVLAYFPRALAYIAQVSKAGNDKHNPGQPLHWSKDKSNDHADCVARHLIEHGTIDPDDNLRHTGKLAWRSLALLETELENLSKAKSVSA